MSTVKANTYQDASGGSNAILYGAASPAGSMGFRNRVINGAMVIDQRNAGASVTPVDSQYTLDRWQCFLTQSSKFTVDQNAGSVTPPTGFNYYAGITSSSAYSITSSDYFGIQQHIEYANTMDLGWGTASAKTITLSFLVYSSLTGTFGGALANYGRTRAYPFTYTISAANTWEQKSITITGDTSGTWGGAVNTGGITVGFGLGVGSTYSAAGGSWAAGLYLSATGATSVVGTNGATWYITGVQLEVGSVATEFERRPFTTELQLCQRYYCKTFDYATAPANNGGNPGMLMCGTISSGNYEPNAMWRFPVEMRSDPTVTLYNPGPGTTGQWTSGGGTTSSNARVGSNGTGGIVIDNTDTTLTGSSNWRIQATASAEL